MTPVRSDNHVLLVMLGQMVGFLQSMASVMAAWAIVSYWREPDSMVWGVWIAVFIIAAVVINLGVIFIHEMGHAIAAWSVRHTVHVINVRALSFSPRRMRFYIEQSKDNREYAGYVLHDPVWPDLSAAKSIWVSFGGPMATGALGFAVFLLAPQFGHYQFPSYFVAALLVLDMVMNLIPLRWGSGTSSDGLHIWQEISGVRWTPQVWAEHRLAVRPYRDNLVTAKEWAALKPYVTQPFFGGPIFRKLLAHAAHEHADEDSLARLPPKLLEPPLEKQPPSRGQ